MFATRWWASVCVCVCVWMFANFINLSLGPPRRRLTMRFSKAVSCGEMGAKNLSLSREIWHHTNRGTRLGCPRNIWVIYTRRGEYLWTDFFFIIFYIYFIISVWMIDEVKWFFFINGYFSAQSDHYFYFFRPSDMAVIFRIMLYHYKIIVLYFIY